MSRETGHLMTGRFPVVTFAAHQMPGVLVVVDGCDGTGKSTLLKMVEGRLRGAGHDPLLTRQPTTEARESQAFRDYLFHPDRRHEIDYRALLCLMIGDRLQHLHRVVRPALQRGRIVLCDRYIYTQMVTTVTRSFEDEPWMIDLYRHVLQPDVAVITDAPVATVINRISARADSRESFYEEDHVRANLDAYREIAATYDLHTIDTVQSSPSRARDETLALITRALHRRTGPPIALVGG